MHRTFTISAALALGLAALTAASALADEALNRKVLKFAVDRLGKKVGDGECWALADQALQGADARRPGTGGYGSYVFGQAINRKSLTPGDVIQFEKVHLERRGPGGSFSSSDLPHHTAIVDHVKGTRVTLLHQNYNSNRTVQRTTLDFADVKRGTLHYYRPQPR